MRSRNTLQAVLEGTLIGAAGLIPGASGGIMAVAFGVYQEALDAIIGLFSNFKGRTWEMASQEQQGL